MRPMVSSSPRVCVCLVETERARTVVDGGVSGVLVFFLNLV